MEPRSLRPPDPPLQAGPIVLRPFRVEDAPAIASACAHPDIPRFTLMAPNMTVADAEEWIQRGLERWSSGGARFAITESDDQALGQVGVGFHWSSNRAETFYWLDPAVRGRGVATTALHLVTSWAFEFEEIARVQLVTHPENAASQRVAERCGYVREGLLRAWETIGTEPLDLVMFSRVRSDSDPGEPDRSGGRRS